MKELNNSSSKLKKLNTFLIKLQGKLQTCQKEHEFFEKNHVCPTCTQDLSDDFREEKLQSGKSKVDEMTLGYNDLLKAIGEEEQRHEQFSKLSNQVMTLNNSISQANFQIGSIKKSISDIENEIKELESSNPDKKAEFVKLEGLISEKKSLNTNISESKDRDVLLTASQLLKDNGIKTRIIKTYLPAMNQLINQYLQSMDFYVNFTLNENFEEIIKSRYRDVFSYDSFSEGEKSRIDIALLLTWRSIAKGSRIAWILTYLF